MHARGETRSPACAGQVRRRPGGAALPGGGIPGRERWVSASEGGPAVVLPSTASDVSPAGPTEPINMREDQAIVARLQQLAVARFGARAQQLAPEQDLFEALGIDSLAALDLL